MPASAFRSGGILGSHPLRTTRPIPLYPRFQALQAACVDEDNFTPRFELTTPEELVKFHKGFGRINGVELYAGVAFKIEHRL